LLSVKFSIYRHVIFAQDYVKWTSISSLKASSPPIGKYSKRCKKQNKTMLIDLSNHFSCLLIDDCMDGEGTTTQSCLASPPKQSKAKFGITKCNKKIILGQKFKANKKIIMGQMEIIIL